MMESENLLALININLVSHVSLALVYAGLLIMLTVGLNMIYSVLKFSNFAHAEWITSGMFASWWCLQILTFAIPWDSTDWSFFGISVNYIINNLFIQAMFAFIMVGLLGIAGEVLVFSRLRKIKASPRSFTVASIGIGLVVRNFLSMIFGDFPKPKTGGTSDAKLPLNIDLGIKWKIIEEETPILGPILGTQGISVTGFEVLFVIVSIITVLLIDFLFRKTKFGIAMRATSDSIELAQVSGINTKRIVYYTWFLAAGLTGFGASIFRANLGRFSVLDGFNMLLVVFTVVILGGVGSFRGGLIAAIIIAYTRQFSLIILTEFQKPIGLSLFPLEEGLEWITTKIFGTALSLTFSPAYADGIAFIVLILVLLFRPQGIFGSVEAARARV